VIDTATNTVVGTPIRVGNYPYGVAVTPDGKHVYVANGSGTVSVIATATNTVVATVAVGNYPYGVAVTPDGKHAYVTNSRSGTVSVIDTTTNTVVASVPVDAAPQGVAVAPDGKHVYVTSQLPVTGLPGTVSVIDTATNTVVAGVAVGNFPSGIVVTPDGKHAFVANSIAGNVSVIDTATNMVVGTPITVGHLPFGVAVTPDGKHVYVANSSFSGTVSVIDTATNSVEAATIMVGIMPLGVGIMPPPVGVPFLAFSATLGIHFGGAPNEDSFNLHSPFTLSSTAPRLHPHRDPVTLQVGSFSITIPPGSFRAQPDGSFTFAGVISGVSLKAQFYHTGTLQYEFHAKARDANLAGTKNTVYVTLTIGGDSGATSVKADIDH
jgi:YVTN family beta-propeller protein